MSYRYDVSVRFAVRLRAYSAVRLKFDDVLDVSWVARDATAKFQSEYTGGDDGRAYAVTLHGEIRGQATDLDDAQAGLAGQMATALTIVAVAGNGAIAPPQLISAHGLDIAAGRQPFIYYGTPHATEWFPPGSRAIDLESTRAFSAAVGHHPQHLLLHQAMEAYRQALRHWYPEELLLAGEWLYIAAETLSRCVIETRASARNITPKNLARLNGLQEADGLRARIVVHDIFGGDSATLEGLRTASDGFEHGYMSLSEAWQLMTPVVEKAFGHVRRAIVDASGVDAQTVAALLAADRNTPIGLAPVMRTIMGHIEKVDDATDVEFDGAAFELSWPRPEAVVQTREGKRVISFPMNVTVDRLPNNVQIQVESVGLRTSGVAPGTSITLEAGDENEPEPS